MMRCRNRLRTPQMFHALNLALDCMLGNSGNTTHEVVSEHSENARSAAMR